MKLVTTAQMRALEQAAVDAGATWQGLMEQAGWGVAQEAIRLLGPVQGRHVLVLVGPGNNGGDGLVVARHLHDAGAHVALYVWRRAESFDDANRTRCRERDIPEVESAGDSGQETLRILLARCDMVIDALLGMGGDRPVTGELAAIVATINNRPPPLILSIDLPTGVHSDNGHILGAAIRADLTVATGLAKRGLLQYPGRAYAGEVKAVDIGLTLAQLEVIMSEVITASRARGLLPARPYDAHKGTFGKVLVMAGSLSYPGAASLATAGAARVGAGLVTLATSRSGLGGPGRLPEVTLHLLPESEWGGMGESAADELLKILDQYQALLVGPGIGHEDHSRLFLERLLGLDSPRHRGKIGFRIGVSADKPAVKQRPELPPTVLDADALTLLSKIDQWWEQLPSSRCVLTPHPGEMKRLLGVEQLDADYAAIAEQSAKRWGQIVVLKGATTVVADPQGRSIVNDGANPALATAGTGDVLSGAITGLLAQGLAPFDAAALGVYLHSAAGRLVHDELGDAGTIASDLLPRLPLAIKALKQTA